jgi:general nucleoside transport system permease protein
VTVTADDPSVSGGAGEGAAVVASGGVRGGRRDALIGTLVVVVGAVLVGVVVVAFLSDEPGRAVRTFLTGSLDGRFQLGTTLARATPYIFTGAALALAFRVGVFNLGAEGQLYLGAAAGTWVAVGLGAPGPITIVVACLAGMVAGGLWGALPGWLRAYYGANEIVLTLMLNFVAILFVSWLVSNPLADPGRPGFPQSERIPEAARLPRLLSPSTLHLGIVVGVVSCVVLHLFVTRTARGFELRTSGQNPEFARYVGMRPERSMLTGMLLSGAVAGLGGAVHIIGDQLRLLDGFSPGYGFIGILVALLARNHLLAVPFAAVFYAWLVSGAQVMEERTDVPREAVSVVQGVLFLLVTASALTMWITARRRSVRA